MSKLSALLTTLFFILFSEAAYPLFTTNGIATSVGAFLKLPAGARASGMGEAFTAVSDDSTAVYWNPAGLNLAEFCSVTLMHSIWFEGMTYDWVSAVFPTGLGKFGVGIQYMDYGSILETNVDGLDLGTFDPSDLSLAVSYGAEIGGVKFGLTAKYISLRIKSYTNMLAGDLGLIAPVELGGMKGRLGASIHNFGTDSVIFNGRESLPTSGNVGGALWLSPLWMVSAEAVFPLDSTVGFAAGTEFSIKADESLTLTARAGYYTRSDPDNLTFGAGVKYESIAFDYAFEPFGDLGNTHRFSLTMEFGKQNKAKNASVYPKAD